MDDWLMRVIKCMCDTRYKIDLHSQLSEYFLFMYRVDHTHRIGDITTPLLIYLIGAHKHFAHLFFL